MVQISNPLYRLEKLHSKFCDKISFFALPDKKSDITKNCKLEVFLLSNLAFVL